MNPSGRILTAIAAVVSCLALVWVYTSIESFAASNDQSAAKTILPVWVTGDDGDDDTTTKLSGDAETPTPTLLPTESSASSEDVDTAIDPSTSELIEAAYKDPVAQEPKKPVDTARRDASLSGASSDSASRPGNHASLPTVESPSTVSPSLGNAVALSPEEPAQGSTDLANGTTEQPVPAQTLPPNTPVVTEASPQPPLELPAGTETSPSLPQDLPAEAATPSQPPSLPEVTTPSDLPSDQSPITKD
jgi:hypothetical protein